MSPESGEHPRVPLPDDTWEPPTEPAAPAARHSTERLEVHRALVLSRVLKAWEMRPDITLGELFAEAFPSLERVRVTRDLDLVEELVRWAGKNITT